jgi:hypothetical protein
MDADGEVRHRRKPDLKVHPCRLAVSWISALSALSAVGPDLKVHPCRSAVSCISATIRVIRGVSFSAVIGVIRGGL